MRAQLLHFGEEPLAQLLYLGTSGAPLALYAKKGEETFTPPFKQYDDIGSVAWSQGGIAYLLAGEGDEASLLAPRRDHQERGQGGRAIRGSAGLLAAAADRISA